MRILAVDDEADTRALLKDLLTQAGHRVTAVSNAVSALLHVKMDAPDLILLDVMMPGMDGHQLAQTLSGAWDTFEIPIVVLSCRKDAESKSWAKINGCVRYLEKPFCPTELLDVIREVEQGRSDGALLDR